jgi:hypothetical protein
MRSSSRLVMSKVPSTLKQGLTYELVNVKLIVLSDIGGAIGAIFEACVSLIRTKVDLQDDAGGLWCHASGLHPNNNLRNHQFRSLICVTLSDTSLVQRHDYMPYCAALPNCC